MVRRTRLELREILTSIPGVVKTYYSPPASIHMEYPCIIYKLANVKIKRADNIPYIGARRYELTLIDEDPDSNIFEQMLKLPYCTFDRMYVADGLNHFIFTIFF